SGRRIAPSVECPPQRRSPMTFVLQFDRRFTFQEQFDDISTRGIRGPMQAGYPTGHRVHLHTHLQQELDYVGAAVLASPAKAALHLAACRIRFQTAILVEEAFDQVEPPHSGRSLQVKARAAFGEMLRGLTATV